MTKENGWTLRDGKPEHIGCGVEHTERFLASMRKQYGAWAYLTEGM